MSKGKRLLALCLMLVLLSSGSALLSHYSESQTAARQETEEEAATVAALEDVEWLDVTFLGERTSLLRADSRWVDAEDPAFPLDASYAEEMAGALSNMQSERSVTGELSEYGLDDPQCTVTARDAQGTELTLQIGDKNKTTGLYYVRVEGLDEIYTVSSSAVMPFLTARYDRIEAEEFPEIAADSVERVTVAADGRTRTLLHLPQGSPTAYTSAYTWFEQTLDGLAPVSAQAAENAVEEALGVVCLGTVRYDAAHEDLARFGLDDPAATLEVTYTQSMRTALDAQERLQVRALTELTNLQKYGLLDDWRVEETPAETAGRVARWQAAEEDGAERDYDVTHVKRLTVWVSAPDADGNSYLRHSGSRRIFSVSSSYAQALAELLPEDLRDDSVCLVEAERVNRLTVSSGGVTKVIDVDRSPVRDEEGILKKNTAYRLGAEEIESAQFSGFINRLNLLQAEAYTDSSDIGSVFMTVIFDQSSARYPSLTLTLYTYDSSFYRASFAGREDMLVNRRDVEALTELFEAIGASKETE